MPKTLPIPAAPAQDVTRGVLASRPFRKLWNSMLYSSLGDWLGLLATTAMAQQLSGGDYATANFAIAGVFIARLLPAAFLGPTAKVKLSRINCVIVTILLLMVIVVQPFASKIVCHPIDCYSCDLVCHSFYSCQVRASVI